MGVFSVHLLWTISFTLAVTWLISKGLLLFGTIVLLSVACVPWVTLSALARAWASSCERGDGVLGSGLLFFGVEKHWQREPWSQGHSYIWTEQEHEPREVWVIVLVVLLPWLVVEWFGLGCLFCEWAWPKVCLINLCLINLKRSEKLQESPSTKFSGPKEPRRVFVPWKF